MCADIVYKAEPTASRFHRSNARVRFLLGPVGTGKSVAACAEILRRSCEQELYHKVRRTRWVAVRNTYAELKSTTIKTWQEWCPGAVMRWDSPITSTFRQKLKDGTTIESEMLFISLDTPDDVRKLKSLDLTGVWLNEVSELPKAVMDMATSRIPRYPQKDHGGATWYGVIADSNMPDDDHWMYALEQDPPEGYEFFRQPGALIKQGNSYIPNPHAENVGHQSIGYDYWLNMISGKTDEWIKVFVLGQYGSTHDGKPVYPEFNSQLHVGRVDIVQKAPLGIGLDFGLTPAAALTQTDSRGRFNVVDELCGTDMGIRTFLTDCLIPHLMKVYPYHWKHRDTMIQCIGDPAGNQRAQTDEKSCFQEVKAAGLKIRAAKTNAWLPRRESVAWFLSKLADGKPTFTIDPCCAILVKGFNGGYRYRRIQVTGEERFTDAPAKNHFSHPHDALQYIALEAGGLQALGTKSTTGARRLPSFRPSGHDMGPLG